MAERRQPRKIAVIVAHQLAGIVGMSGYLPLAETMQAEHTAVSLKTPIFMAHGSRDPVVASANARQAAEWWTAGSNAAEGAPRAAQRGQRRGMTVTDFKARGRTAATLCEIDGLGHAWSGGDGRHPFGDAAGPDASRLAWAFVLRQLRRPD